MKRGIEMFLSAGFLIALCGCGGGPSGSGASATSELRVNGGGSSFVNPLMSRWAGEYDQKKAGRINYQSVGSGAGIQQMIVKTFDFGCTDAPLNEEQLQQARQNGGEVIHIPLAMGAVVAAYNLDEAKEPLRFTGPVLADIFLGKIKRWNDKALLDLNPGATLPDQEISVVRRSDGSGTTFIWVDYLSKVSPEWKEKVGVGTSVNWPTGVGQKGNEGVAGQVKRSPGSIGYIELTYAVQNGIKFGQIQNKEGTFVTPGLESVTAAAAGALADIPDDLRYSLTNAPGKESYPVSGTVWAVLYANQPAANAKMLADFFRWATHDGQQHTAELHYARLPPGLVAKLEKKLELIQPIR